MVLEPGGRESLTTAGNNGPCEDAVGVRKKGQYDKVSSLLHTNN